MKHLSYRKNFQVGLSHIAVIVVAVFVTGSISDLIVRSNSMSHAVKNRATVRASLVEGDYKTFTAFDALRMLLKERLNYYFDEQNTIAFGYEMERICPLIDTEPALRDKLTKEREAVKLVRVTFAKYDHFTLNSGLNRISEICNKPKNWRRYMLISTVKNIGSAQHNKTLISRK